MGLEQSQCRHPVRRHHPPFPEGLWFKRYAEVNASRGGGVRDSGREAGPAARRLGARTWQRLSHRCPLALARGVRGGWRQPPKEKANEVSDIRPRALTATTSPRHGCSGPAARRHSLAAGHHRRKPLERSITGSPGAICCRTCSCCCCGSGGVGSSVEGDARTTRLTRFAATHWPGGAPVCCFGSRCHSATRPVYDNGWPCCCSSRHPRAPALSAQQPGLLAISVLEPRGRSAVYVI